MLTVRNVVHSRAPGALRSYRCRIRTETWEPAAYFSSTCMLSPISACASSIGHGCNLIVRALGVRVLKPSCFAYEPNDVSMGGEHCAAGEVPITRG